MKVNVKKVGKRIVIKRGRISEGFFENRRDIAEVCIGPRVSFVGAHAFRNCINLRKVEIQKGDCETVDAEAFAGCRNLRDVRLPEGDILLWGVFKGCDSLPEPVFNRSKTILQYYPVTRRDTKYVVPETVRSIGATCFTDNPYLREVVLPESVQELHPRCFSGSNVKSVSIPATIHTLKDKTFLNCRHLERIRFAGDTKLEIGALEGCPPDLEIVGTSKYSTDQKYWAVKMPYLNRTDRPLPDGSHLEDPVFWHLCDACSNGSSRAMWDLGCYFENLSEEKDDFYDLSGNFWKFLGYLSGDPAATEWFSAYDEKNPGVRLKAPIDESRSGMIPGKVLQYLGYYSFNPDSDYILAPTGNLGVTVIKQLYPDGVHYDLTYYDEYLNDLGTSCYGYLTEETQEASKDLLWWMCGEAVKASLERNRATRPGNRYIVQFG